MTDGPVGPPDGTPRLEQMTAALLPQAVRNPKRHDDAALRASLSRFGFVEPVLIDERTGRLVAGHGRLDNVRALERAGAPLPTGITLDTHGRWCLPVIRGLSFATDADATAYLIASNRLTELGGWENSPLADALRAIAAVDPGLLAITAFDPAFISELIGDDTGDGDPFGNTDPDPDLVDDVYREQFGLLVPCADVDQADMIALVLVEHGYAARSILA